MDVISMPLPIELVLNVMDQLLPESPHVFLPPSHPITQTLLSFRLVCRETRRVATAYLLKHCVYLSSKSRLASLVLQLRTRPELRNISCLLLAPFEDHSDDWDSGIATMKLFMFTAPTLKRLVLDIPRRKFGHTFALCPMLVQGLRTLENLEEFAGVYSEWYFKQESETIEPPFWTEWRKLKRLALDMALEPEPGFWYNIAKLPELETLVLTNPQGIGNPEDLGPNLKEAYFSLTERPLKVLLIHYDTHELRLGCSFRSGWSTIDPENKMAIVTLRLSSAHKRMTFEKTGFIYLRAGAENGTLWDWDGKVRPNTLISHTDKCSRCLF